MLPWIALTAAATSCLLVFDARGRHGLAGAAKLVASASFLGAAASVGALDDTYGQTIFVGLILSAVGDACLISTRPGPFLAGLGSFLLAHVAYTVAFLGAGPDMIATLMAAAILALPAVVVWRWLSPHVEAAMRMPVRLYMLAISLMVAAAVGMTWSGGTPLALVGAIAFYLSDLSVARDRFVAPGLVNRAWGLPLYFGAQLVLAASTVASSTGG